VKNRRPSEGEGAVSPNYLVEMVKRLKLGEFNKFKPRDYIMDKGKHRQSIR
jgi:hypothetical protein